MDYNTEAKEFKNSILMLGDKRRAFTVQLFKKKLEDIFKPQGTGVLFRSPSGYFVLTAAHVLEDAPLFAIADNYIQLLSGEYEEIDNKPKRTIDIGYIKLNDTAITFLQKSYQFLAEDDLHLSHVPASVLQYVVIGFTERETRINATENKVRAIASYFNLQMAKNEVYRYFDLEGSKQYALDFKGKLENYQTGIKEKIHDPYGLSGAGLWIVVQKKNAEMYEFQLRLIGIMTEFKKSRYHCLIANKIEVFLRYIGY